MGITVKQAYERQERAIMQARDAYSAARIFGLTSTELDAKLNAIQETTLAKCPQWAIAAFRGYARALSDENYRRYLVFGGFVDGRFYSTHHDRPDYYGKHGIAPADYADDGRVTMRGHYWATTREPRPFFVSPSR